MLFWERTRKERVLLVTRGECGDSFRGTSSTQAGLHISRLDIFNIRERELGRYQVCKSLANQISVLYRQINNKSHSFQAGKCIIFKKKTKYTVIQLFLLHLYFEGWSSIDFCEFNPHPSCIINVNLSQTAGREKEKESLTDARLRHGKQRLLSSHTKPSVYRETHALPRENTI